jgi:hypothetical protein
MSENLFPENIELDTAYLNDTYSGDAETALMMFETYLQELDSNLRDLRDSFNKQDIDTFRKLVHKQKPAFSYVGLTDLTEKFQQLQAGCQQVSDLQIHREEILSSFERIASTKPVVEQCLGFLRQQV